MMPSVCTVQKPLIFMRFHGVFLGSQHEIWSKQHIPPDLVVGRLSTTLIASRGEDLQVEHPV